MTRKRKKNCQTEIHAAPAEPARFAVAEDIEKWPIDRLQPYGRNPRRNDAAVDHMCLSIREFGFKIPCLVRGDGEVVDGHLRLKAARKLGIQQIPVILCDEWTTDQVRAFRLLVNRSATWAEWDDHLLSAELSDLKMAAVDLKLTGFDSKELDKLLRQEPQGEDETPALPSTPVTQPGDLWICGPHRVLCGDATDSGAVVRVLGERKPELLVTDPPYGVELDSKWRDGAGFKGRGKGAKRRTPGHRKTSASDNTRADWSDAFALVPSLEVGYVWHASKYTREVLDGLLRIGFEHYHQIIWDKGRAVMTGGHYWNQHEPCWYVRKKNAQWYGKPGENSTIWTSASPKFIMGGSEEKKFVHSAQKPADLMRRAILNHTRPAELVYDPFLGSGTTLVAAEETGRICCGIELDPKYVDVVVERWQTLTGQVATLETDLRSFHSVAQGRLKEAA